MWQQRLLSMCCAAVPPEEGQGQAAGKKPTCLVHRCHQQWQRRTARRLTWVTLPRDSGVRSRLAQLLVPCVQIVYPHLFVLSSDITLRYKEIRRQKQEHRHEKDKCLSNGDGHPSVLDEQDGSKLRDRKL